MKTARQTPLIRYEEMLERIATTLGVTPADLSLNRVQINERGSAIHCLGTASHSPFFAKVLPLDQFPRLEPMTFPSEELFRRGHNTRSAKEQIETEWSTADRLRGIAGAVDTPKVVARSVPCSTIIWETVAGEPLDRLIKTSRWRDPTGTTGAAALRQTGVWLRTAHDLFFSRAVTVNMRELCTILARYARMSRSRDFNCICTALAVLRSAHRRLGGKDVAVPVSLTHGDLSLPNILWSSDSGRVAIVDFEHSEYRMVLHDLVALMSNLRAKLLNPVIPPRVALKWEEAFWEGYGPLSQDIKITVDGLASAWIFYWFLPRVSIRARRRGFLRYLLATVYQYCIVPSLTRKTLTDCI